MNTNGIIQKLSNCCNVLHDDMSYGDYVEQLTNMVYLKMTDDRLRQSILGYAFFANMAGETNMDRKKAA